MWWGIILIVSGVGAQSGHLTGEHVCTREESYTVTFEKPFLRNVTIREYVWCLGVPPRCSKYHTQLKTDFEVFEEKRTRITQYCCPGYREDSTSVHCVPECLNCDQGECVKPEQCECNSGYTGFACNLTCLADKWGRNCMQECDCRNGAACDPDTGSCHCTNGWTGLACNIPYNKTNPNAHKFVQHECLDCDEPLTPQGKQDVITSTSKSEPAPEELNLPFSEQEPEIVTPQEIDEEINNNLDSTRVEADIPHVTTSAKMKVYDKGHEQENSEQWPMGEMRTFPKRETTVKSLYYVITITIGVIASLIFIAVITVLIVRYKNRRYILKKCDNPRNNKEDEIGDNPVIYRRSAFNIPLPDPPTFQNPLPTVLSNERRNSDDYLNLQNIQLYNNVKETSMDLQYDYPPSTGSYRAASVPDPDAEPLYDEIPSLTRPVLASNQSGSHSQRNSFINLSFAGLNSCNKRDN